MPGIWAVQGLTAMQKMVLLALAQFAGKTGANAMPAQATLATMCCTSDRTVRRCLTVLVEKGHITPTGKGRKGTTRFQINTEIRPPAMSTQGGHRSPTIHLNNPSKKDSYVLPSPTGVQTIDKFSDVRQRNEPGYVTLARMDRQRQQKR
jgi:hypothetical protein